MYGKIVDGILTQKQPNPQSGFVGIPGDAICGQVTTDGGLTFTDPVISLADAKITKNIELEAAFEAACNVDVTHNSKVFQGDEKARTNLKEAMVHRQAGGTLPGGFAWRALDNENVVFTDADIDGLILAIGTNKLDAVANLHVKKDAVIAAVDAAEVAAISW